MGISLHTFTERSVSFHAHLSILIYIYDSNPYLTALGTSMAVSYWSKYTHPKRSSLFEGFDLKLVHTESIYYWSWVSEHYQLYINSYPNRFIKKASLNIVPKHTRTYTYMLGTCPKLTLTSTPWQLHMFVKLWHKAPVTQAGLWLRQP